MTCWYCHWGWPAPVMEIYRKGVEVAGDMMDFGPAHVVWSDENFDTQCVQSCIDEFPTFDWSDHVDMGSDVTEETKAEVLASLKELLLIPEKIRYCEPDDYDGEHPENFPPPAGIVMVAK